MENGHTSTRYFARLEERLIVCTRRPLWSKQDLFKQKKKAFCTVQTTSVIPVFFTTEETKHGPILDRVISSVH